MIRSVGRYKYEKRILPLKEQGFKKAAAGSFEFRSSTSRNRNYRRDRGGQKYGARFRNRASLDVRGLLVLHFSQRGGRLCARQIPAMTERARRVPVFRG